MCQFMSLLTEHFDIYLFFWMQYAGICLFKVHALCMISEVKYN